MRAHVGYDRKLGVVTLEAAGGCDDEDRRLVLRDQMRELGAYAPKRIFIDYSELEQDLFHDDLEGLLAVAQPVIERLRSVKTAAVLNDQLRVTAVALSLMFIMGFRVAIFPTREEALAWLDEEEQDPEWLPCAGRA